MTPDDIGNGISLSASVMQVNDSYVNILHYYDESNFVGFRLMEDREQNIPSMESVLAWVSRAIGAPAQMDALVLIRSITVAGNVYTPLDDGGRKLISSGPVALYSAVPFCGCLHTLLRDLPSVVGTDFSDLPGVENPKEEHMSFLRGYLEAVEKAVGPMSESGLEAKTLNG